MLDRYFQIPLVCLMSSAGIKILFQKKKKTNWNVLTVLMVNNCPTYFEQRKLAGDITEEVLTRSKLHLAATRS